ncbi:T6SS immunity protein Tdi1 domain-containing protein [Pseudactinotalea sp.]|uniref:T6SS immunity protein Tdi1 domain-containing protein n=1 Tax=Pseudactinotalea sp. TaxID=1926260 RepID=UPI003B3A322F
MSTPHLGDLAGWTPYTFSPEPVSTAEFMPSWPRVHDPYPLLHGFSRLGHVFLSDSAQQQFCVVYPLQGGSKGYPAGSLAEFQRTVTGDPGFQAWIFPPDLVRPVVDRLGPIDPDQVYMPVPYPMLGGSGAPESYDKGDVWVFLEIVGQLWQQA